MLFNISECFARSTEHWYFPAWAYSSLPHSKRIQFGILHQIAGHWKAIIQLRLYSWPLAPGRPWPTRPNESLVYVTIRYIIVFFFLCIQRRARLYEKPKEKLWSLVEQTLLVLPEVELITLGTASTPPMMAYLDSLCGSYYLRPIRAGWLHTYFHHLLWPPTCTSIKL